VALFSFCAKFFFLLKNPSSPPGKQSKHTLHTPVPPQFISIFTTIPRRPTNKMCVEIIQRYKCGCTRRPSKVEDCSRRKPHQAPGTCDFCYSYHEEKLGYMCDPCLAASAIACAKIVGEVKKNLVDIYPERKGKQSAQKSLPSSPTLSEEFIADWF
jgi:hypothetical protein